MFLHCPLSFFWENKWHYFFLGFFSPLLLRVSCLQLIFIKQQVISLWNSLLQDVSHTLDSEWIVLLFEQTENPKSQNHLLKTVQKRCFKLLLWLPGLCGGYSYSAGYPQAAVADVTFASQDAGWDSGLSAWPCLNTSVSFFTLFAAWYQSSCLLTRLPQWQAGRPSSGFYKTHLILHICVCSE